MITIAKIKQATSEFVKVLRYGLKDVQTVINSAPHGIDSKPTANSTGLHATTGNKDDSVFLGCIYSSETTKEGETRIYATNSDGDEVFSIFLKNDGTCEFNGNTDNLIKFLPLSNALTAQANAINAELTKIAAGIATGGGSYTPTPVSIDISGAKIDKIKV